MGNVVSSLLMYALQAAWFCQRLIDQDYRQNHGSRSKPIMDIDETDLDVFLSKCRSYYMSKNKCKNEIEYKQSSVNEHTKKKKVHRKTRIDGEDSEISSRPHLVSNKSGIHASNYTCLDFDSDGFLSKMDQELAPRLVSGESSRLVMINRRISKGSAIANPTKSFRQAEFTRLIMNENDFDNFQPESRECYETPENANERNKYGSSKTERWKRKKLYYRQRYNPKSGPDKTVDTFNLQCEAYPVPKEIEILTTDRQDIDSASRDDCLNFSSEDLTSDDHGKEKSDPEMRKGLGLGRDLEATAEDVLSPAQASEVAGHGFAATVKTLDSDRVGKEEDEVILDKQVQAKLTDKLFLRK